MQTAVQSRPKLVSGFALRFVFSARFFGQGTVYIGLARFICIESWFLYNVLRHPILRPYCLVSTKTCDSSSASMREDLGCAARPTSEPLTPIIYNQYHLQNEMNLSIQYDGLCVLALYLHLVTSITRDGILADARHTLPHLNPTDPDSTIVGVGSRTQQCAFSIAARLANLALLRTWSATTQSLLCLLRAWFGENLSTTSAH